MAEALLTLEEAQVYLRRADAAVADVIARGINYVTGAAEQYCARRLKRRAYAGATALVADGTGDNWVVLPEWPADVPTAARQVLGDGTTEAVDLTGARVASDGVLYAYGVRFASGSRNYEFDVVAGYDATDHPGEWKALVAAALRWLQVWFQDHQNALGRGQNLSVGPESVSLALDPIPPDVKLALRPFRRIW